MGAASAQVTNMARRIVRLESDLDRYRTAMEYVHQCRLDPFRPALERLEDADDRCREALKEGAVT